jgi:hypothetical protein
MNVPRGIAAIAAIVVLMLAYPLVSLTAVSAQATPAPANGATLTPLLPLVPSPPRWFTGSDQRVHLVYELQLTNAFPVPVTVTSVVARDAVTGQRVAALNGKALTAAMSLLSTPTVVTTAIPASGIGVVWLDIALASWEDVPAAVSNEVTVSVPPGLPVPESIAFTGPAVDVDLRPPVVIGPPLTGPGWLAAGSCCDGPHRRAYQPIDGLLYLSQRFAIDFNALDAEDRLVVGDPAQNASYPSFGRRVVAVAAGAVVTAVDQYPDQAPNDPQHVTLENADGNHVVVDLGDGRYAFYAHLKAGSVKVLAGDLVQPGQEIGELGNSGSSTGPHLHFHVMNGPSPLAADGLPYVFADFELSGRTPPLAELEADAMSGAPIPIDRGDAGARHDALPLGSDVVDFPGSSDGA